ncbi:MAG: ORF6N domain-containing protein [Candidatus Omnitrophica bacterium]|nr:ORF6N domain-containing protein [Candidatus Omnitrophota bacterium]MDD5671438.1 ORF6N domain-containing protein [Candidatus Omnitrophota bacterium]
MKNSSMTTEKIFEKILMIRGQRVMLDYDLARLYDVSTKRLKEQVRRNLERFPADFMYTLSKQEASILRSQIASSNWGGRRYQPYAFTEQGVAMLSSVLKSGRAIQVNIQIMRAFVKLKEILSTNKELAHKLDQLEHKIERHDDAIRSIFSAIRQLMKPPEPPRRRIGFQP